MNAATSRARRYDADLGLGTGAAPPRARRCSPRSPIPAWGPARAGHGGCRAGGAAVVYVLAGRVDEVGPGLHAADLERAPAELRVEAPGIEVLLADAEVTRRRPGGRH